jgi:hypothetical protein
VYAAPLSCSAGRDQADFTDARAGAAPRSRSKHGPNITDFQTIYHNHSEGLFERIQVQSMISPVRSKQSQDSQAPQVGKAIRCAGSRSASFPVLYRILQGNGNGIEPDKKSAGTAVQSASTRLSRSAVPIPCGPVASTMDLQWKEGQ